MQKKKTETDANKRNLKSVSKSVFFFRAGCGLMMCFSPTAPKSQEVEEQFLPKPEQG